MNIEEDALGKLKTIFDRARSNSDFGNGRYVRNLLERAEMCQASRILSMDVDSVKKRDLLTIKAEDIEMPVEQKYVERKVVGFV